MTKPKIISVEIKQRLKMDIGDLASTFEYVKVYNGWCVRVEAKLTELELNNLLETIQKLNKKFPDGIINLNDKK